MGKKKPEPEEEIEEIIVRSMRSGFTWFDNAIVDDWLTILGTEIFAIYAIYCRRAMNTTQSTKLAQEVIAQHLGIRRNTVSEAMVVLELCDLVKIVREHWGISTIYLKNTTPITPEVIAAIQERCNNDQKHAKLRQMLLTRLENFKSLSTKIDDFVEQSNNKKLKIRVVPAEPKPIVLKVESTSLKTPSPEPTINNALTSQWQQIKEQLRGQLTQATYDTWVKHTELVSIEGNQWVVECESTFAKDWLTERLNGTLVKAASQVAGQAVALDFVVNKK